MKYIHHLAPLRFFAALIIVYLHFGQFIFPFNIPPLDKLIYGGYSALSFFFFLSGFVLAYNYIGERPISWKSFFIKRFARVYPVYLLAMFLTLILGMAILEIYPKGLSLIIQALGFQAWMPGNAGGLNFPSWTVSVEISMYLLFPLIVLFYKRFGLKVFTIFTITFWALSFIQHLTFMDQFDIVSNEKLRQFTFYFPVWHFNGFIFGILGGLFVKQQNNKSNINYVKWRLWYILGSSALLFYFYQFNGNVHYIHNGALIPLYFIICSGFSIDHSKFTRFLSKPIFTELGNTSYAFYILQFPIFILFVWISGTRVLSTQYFYSYLFTLFIVSYLIHKYFENPARNSIVKKMANRKVGDRLIDSDK